MLQNTLGMSQMADPLTPRLLPAAPAALFHSADTPSVGPVRPFGLTRITHLADDDALLSLDGMTYDPERQVNVHQNGSPLTGPELMLAAATNQNTQADHQWWTDKD